MSGIPPICTLPGRMIGDPFDSHDAAMSLPENEALVLCRTPFQAVILREVLKQERPAVRDLVYLTHDDATEDRHYFLELAACARAAQYLYVPSQRFDILTHIYAWRQLSQQFKLASYSQVYAASLNSLVFRKLLAHHPAAKLVSFDDGAANIVPNSMYLNDRPGPRARIYEASFRIPSLRKIRDRSVLHYSVYPGFDNVMAPTPTRHISLFPDDVAVDRSQASVRVLIGQPFHEYLPQPRVAELRAWLATKEIDYYVTHPREKCPLLPQVPILAKAGRVAEEAILSFGSTRPLTMYGGFSSVMLNIPNSLVEKIMVLPKDAPGLTDYEILALKAGCRIIRLPD